MSMEHLPELEVRLSITVASKVANLDARRAMPNANKGTWHTVKQSLWRMTSLDQRPSYD